ncbi:MAG: YlxR family protein [bacterium]
MINRKCVGCGEIKDKSFLVRIMRDHKTGDIVLLPNSRQFGRSLYICYNKECLKNAFKKKRFQKTLKKEISNSVLKNLEEIVFCNKGND